MTEPDAYFIRTSDGRFLPQRHCAGAWNPAELHISPVNGLLMHELERWLARREGATAGVVTRLSLDYLGVLDFEPCELRIEVVRPGRSVELVEAVLSQHGRPVLRGRAWLVVSNDTTDVEGGARAPLPPPDVASPHAMSVDWPGDYVRSLDVRAVQGPQPGRTTAWMTTPLDIVDGDLTSELARFVLLVDTANGIAVRESPAAWQFPNVDLTIHLFRQPRGRWIGFDTRVVFGPDGHGLTGSDLFDEHGHVGRAEQALLVRRRSR